MRPARRTVRRVLRERWLLIAFVTMVFSGVAALFDLRSPTTWAPYSVIEVGTLTPDTPFLGIRTLKPEVSTETAANRVRGVVTEPEVLRDARRRLGPAAPSGYSLDGRVQAAPSRAPGQVNLVVLDQDRDRGVRAADALAASVAAAIRRREVGRLDRVIAAMRRERRSIPAPDAGSDRTITRRRVLAAIRRDQLERRIAALESVRELAAPARVVAPAFRPKQPDFKPGYRTWPAIYMGLSVGMLAAFVLDALARRPRDTRRMVAAAGLPVVGRVPRLGWLRRDPIELAYRHLRAAAQGLGREARARILLVTSPDPGAGKSTVALGMAYAAASAGRRACVVECDFHRSTLALRLGIDSPGLGAVLDGGAGLDEALVETAPEGGAPVAVIPAGRRMRRTSETLGSSAFAELLASLAESFDLVILDAPPLLASSDALALVPQSEVVLVCGRVGRTPLDELEAAHQALERLPEVPAGLVLTGIPAKRAIPMPRRDPWQRPSTGEA